LRRRRRFGEAAKEERDKEHLRRIIRIQKLAPKVQRRRRRRS
jgi:hypothetical protein